MIFLKFAAVLWPLIDIDWDYYALPDLLTILVTMGERFQVYA